MAGFRAKIDAYPAGPPRLIPRLIPRSPPDNGQKHAINPAATPRIIQIILTIQRITENPTYSVRIFLWRGRPLAAVLTHSTRIFPVFYACQNGETRTGATSLLRILPVFYALAVFPLECFYQNADITGVAHICTAGGSMLLRQFT